MKWDIKKSNEIKERIAKDEKLMRELSKSVDEVLKKHGIELKGVSYVFEPRVFSMDPDEAPEIMMKSRDAMVQAIIEALYKKEPMPDRIFDEAKYLKVMKCIPECGGMDPFTLRMLEKYRIIPEDIVADDPIPPSTSAAFIKRIVGNKKLLRDFSETVFGVIGKNGITFAENEGCVFTPYVFETPIFAQKVGVADSVKQIRGFGPQIYADPTPEPAAEMKIRVFPGIIDTPQWRTVGVICHPWWWIGLPSPEILNALDVIRGVGKEWARR